MENVVKNAEDIYELRNKIINEIKKAETKQSEELEQSEQFEEDDKIDFNWIRGSKGDLEKIKKLVSKAKIFNITVDGNYKAIIYPSKLETFLNMILKTEKQNQK